MFRESSFAVIAENKAVHRLVCSVYLDLNKSSFVTIALLAQEKALELIALSLNFLVLPVSPLLPHALQHHFFSLFLLFFTCQFTCIHAQQLLWSQFSCHQQHVEKTFVCLVLNVIYYWATFVAIGLTVFVFSIYLILQTHSTLVCPLFILYCSSEHLNYLIPYFISICESSWRRILILLCSWVAKLWL